MKVSGERDLTDSPCIGICSTSALGDEVCVGCHRTFDEVRLWNTMTDDEKIKINKRLQNRELEKKYVGI